MEWKCNKENHSWRTGIWNTTLQARLFPEEYDIVKSAVDWEFNPHAKQCLALIGILVVTGLDWTGRAALVVSCAVWTLQRADGLSSPPVDGDIQLYCRFSLFRPKMKLTLQGFQSPHRLQHKLQLQCKDIHSRPQPRSIRRNAGDAGGTYVAATGVCDTLGQVRTNRNLVMKR